MGMMRCVRCGEDMLIEHEDVAIWKDAMIPQRWRCEHCGYTVPGLALTGEDAENAWHIWAEAMNASEVAV